MDKVVGMNPESLRFRNQSSSKVLNKHGADTLYDVLNIVNRQNTLDARIKRVRHVVGVESTYNAMTVQKLVEENMKLKNEIAEMKSTDDLRKLTIMPKDMQIKGRDEEAAHIDMVNNCVTLPFALNESKLTIYDDVAKKIFIPHSLKISSRVLQGPKIESFEESDVKYAVNGNMEDYWTVKAICAQDVSEMAIEVIIEMPDDIISSRDVNTIIINPFPYKGIDITAIEYKLFGDWTPVETMIEHNRVTCKTPEGGIVTPVFEECENIMLSFKEVHAKFIKLKLRQTKYTEENGKHIFNMGLRHVGVYNRAYYAQSASFYVELDFKKATTIYKADAVLNNQNETGDNTMKYEFFSMDEFDVPARISKSLPFGVENGKLLVKCSIHNGHTSPNLSAVQIFYK